MPLLIMLHFMGQFIDKLNVFKIVHLNKIRLVNDTSIYFLRKLIGLSSDICTNTFFATLIMI